MKFIFTRKQTAFIIAETLAVMFVFAVIGGSFFVWRMLSGPVDVDFARSYIESALGDEEAGIKVSMDKVVLFWPEVRGPLLLGFENSRVFGKDGHLIISIDEAALGLSKSRLLIGQIAPTALILKKPALRITRLEDNSFDIGLASNDVTVGPSPRARIQEDPIKQALQLLTKPENSKDTPSSLAYLRTFRIEEAQVIVDDRIVDMSWTVPSLSMTVSREDGGLHSDATILFSEADNFTPALKFDAFMNLATGITDAKVMLEYFEPEMLSQKIPQLGFMKGVEGHLNAQMNVKMDGQQKILSADFTALSEGGALSIPEVSKDPISFANLGVLAKYDGASKTLEVTSGKLSLNNNVTVGLGATLSVTEGTFTGPVRLEIDHIAQAELGALWPDMLQEEAAYEWAVEKLSKGEFSNIYAQLDLKSVQNETKYETMLDNVQAGFDFTGMDIDYRAPLKPITNASGQGAFDMKAETLKIDVVDAKMLDMDIPKASVFLQKIIEKGKGQAQVDIKLRGPLKFALTFVQDEPITVKTSIDVANSEGAADLDVQVLLPTRKDIKMADVGISVAGTLTDVKLPNVVKGLTLTGGPLNLTVKDNKMTVKGKGKLDGQDATLEYSEFLNANGQEYSSKVDIDMLTTQAMREKMGIDLSVFLLGDAGIKGTYTSFPNKTAVADMTADIGPSTLIVTPFDYQKDPGKSGSIKFTAHLANGDLKEIKDLTGSAPNLSLEKSTMSFRQQGAETKLAAGTVSRFTLDETVGAVKFDIAENGFLKLTMDGPFMDLRPFLNNEEEQGKPYTAPPMQVSMAVDRMRTAEKEQVQYAKIYAYIDGEGRFNQLEMDGIVGSGDLYVRYKPDETGKRTFRLEADDAGATLKAFDIYPNIIGGQMIIYGEPIKGVYDRNLKGRAEITNFKVVRAPALAKLLGLMSLNGVSQALNNEGLVFTKLESQFDWVYRPKGSVLVLKDGRTSGNAVGLTFDGTFDNAAQMIDVEGTVIPLSGVNKIIGSIPLVGDILTGGTGSLIAATYSMKGVGADVKTFVNPLSVLTPGILRRILFEGSAPTVKPEAEPAPAPASVPAPASKDAPKQQNAPAN